MAKVGPMGWGLPQQTLNEKIRAERAAFDDLAKRVPRMLSRLPAKKVLNQELLDKVHKMVKEDGWDEGFSLRHLYKAIMKDAPIFKPQLIGSCVASGDMRTTTYRMMAEVFLLNDPEELPGWEGWGPDTISFFAPFNYRAGRREAGINGYSDGSLCLPHIKGKMKYGHLPCKTPYLQSDEFPEPQNTRTYKQWGASNSLMDKFLDQAGKYKLLESEPVKSPDDIWELITVHFKPANICSSWGFRAGQRLSARSVQGNPMYQWTRGREPWPHNMSVVGMFVLNGRRYINIENSWGNFHNGNQDFVVEENEMARWLRDAECQSVGEIDMSDSPNPIPELED